MYSFFAYNLAKGAILSAGTAAALAGRPGIAKTIGKGVMPMAKPLITEAVKAVTENIASVISGGNDSTPNSQHTAASVADPFDTSAASAETPSSVKGPVQDVSFEEVPKD